MMNLAMSARYHQLSEKWYLRLNDFGTFLSLLAGSAVFAGLLRESTLLTTVAAGLVTIFSVINLVVGTELEAKVHEITSDEELRAEIKKIERDDGPIIPALVWAAYHQNLLRWGQDTKEAENAKRDLHWWQRLPLLLV